jgi:hypothetical protein
MGGHSRSKYALRKSLVLNCPLDRAAYEAIVEERRKIKEQTIYGRRLKHQLETV